jgi:hypothetical protein
LQLYNESNLVIEMVANIIGRLSFSMNLKKYRLICLYRSNLSQSGFAMPLALGLGLVMIIVTASTIARSQSDRSTSNFQKQSSRALSVSEAGVIRIKSFLDRYKLLANKNLDQWVDTLNTLPESQRTCAMIDLSQAKQQSQLFKERRWINLDNSNPNKGRYRIVDYQYQAGVGMLTVAGSIDAYNTSENSSTSILKLTMPIESETAKVPPPALWAYTFKTNPKQQISGQIRGVICPQSTKEDPDGITGIDRTNIAQIEDRPTGIIIADPFTSIPIPKDPPNIAARIPAITTSIRFPLNASDLPDDNGEYNYLVDIDNTKSKYSIKLKDTDRIQIDIAPTHKVNLYLKGNIDLAGSQTINVNSTHPNLRIYGSDRTTKFSIKNNASITSFIHTPFAVAQNIKSTTISPVGNITGGIWVKSWDSATSQGDIPIIQSGTWKDFGIDADAQPPQLNPVSYWRRVEGN